MSKHGTLKDYEGNKIYPNAYYKVGDIFITTNNENPADRFGGTWEKLPEETFLMTASSKYAVKATGGENTHKLTMSEMPSHNHNVLVSSTNGTAEAILRGTSNAIGRALTTNTGDGQPHNNMPKFYAVYIWIRVA